MHGGVVRCVSLAKVGRPIERVLIEEERRGPNGSSLFSIDHRDRCMLMPFRTRAERCTCLTQYATKPLRHSGARRARPHGSPAAAAEAARERSDCGSKRTERWICHHCHHHWGA